MQSSDDTGDDVPAFWDIKVYDDGQETDTIRGLSFSRANQLMGIFDREGVHATAMGYDEDGETMIRLETVNSDCFSPTDYRIVREIDEHPIPLDQEEINTLWEDNNHKERDPPSVDEAHERFTRSIAEYGEWQVFRAIYPFESRGVVFWNGSYGKGFDVDDSEGSWHHLVNVFAEIVDEEGDCRDAEYSSSTRQSSAIRQTCKNCGSWWTVG